MPTDSTCKDCGRALRVADEHAGMHAQCPVCNTTHPISETLAKYFTRIPTGAEFGPVSREVLEQWIREHRVNAACFIREEGQSTWIPFLEWAQSQTATTESLSNPVPTPPRESKSNNPFGEIPLGEHREIQFRKTSHGMTVLILGIAAWVLCITWVGTIPIAIIALVLGFRDLRNIARGETPPGEHHLTKMGLWLAGTALLFNLAILAWLVVASIN
ncbi:MAG: hypothetical protein ACK6DC_14325 [Planctomycetota bacterium]|jgi:hypothetical protein